MVSKFAALSSVSLFALMGASPALAQDQSTTPSQATAPADTASTDIVVTGIRASLAKAADIKRDSYNVVDSIVADDIGKLPDRTVAAALQRVPGVQVTVGDNNEIVNPIIRGLYQVPRSLTQRRGFPSRS
ncbi:hypothetical protein GCM10008023_41650 [Sphingomonas glacialis]|uniref:TonB-dependent receptor plug domain-containing protein n=1 Tax=Sphingomonas glacialis TaxID=658225 RepID=A0ABQ3LW61_9SPHN|nr:TonB-dependent receptor plug domain-containing protein [Sphingomonas glacialis]GHH26698.1 hypothetical protein GCM10008023_41650 [Sphingomonas glacialis]